MFNIPEIPAQTPTYLFAAVNLLLLAYFNRFHALSTRIRDLAAKDKPQQVKLLRKRLEYAREMILWGLLGVALGIMDVLLISIGYNGIGVILFALAIGCVLTSIFYAALEIRDGTKALDHELFLHSEKFSNWEKGQ
jgi:hypothetical protein